MPKFFQTDIAAYGGEKVTFTNVKFKQRGSFENTSAAEAGTLLEIIPVHIKNPPVIQFMAYLDTLKDTFSPDYKEEKIYGRPDPYYIWKSAGRNIAVGWSIFSTSVSNGLDNLNNLSWFLSALYPTYKDALTATSIAASPMFRVRYANLISSPTSDGQGILCVIKGVTVTPSFKDGFISVSPKNTGKSSANIDARVLSAAGFEGSFHEGKKILIPKSIKIGCTLNIVHDHPLGWDITSGEWRGGNAAPGFPYNFGLRRDTQEPGAAASSDGGTQEALPGSTAANNEGATGRIVLQGGAFDDPKTLNASGKNEGLF